MEFDTEVDRVITDSGKAKRSSTRVHRTNWRGQMEHHLGMGQRMEVWR